MFKTRNIGIGSILRNVAFVAGCFVLGYFFLLWLGERNKLITALHKAEDAKLASLEKNEAKK